jgi:hypothetical protein
MSIDQKPTESEQEYFKRRDLELMAEMRERMDAERRKASVARHCPVDGTALQQETFHDITIDVCPTCRGHWLDAGELEQLARVEHAALGGFVQHLFRLKR